MQYVVRPRILLKPYTFFYRISAFCPHETFESFHRNHMIFLKPLPRVDFLDPTGLVNSYGRLIQGNFEVN